MCYNTLYSQKNLNLEHNCKALWKRNDIVKVSMHTLRVNVNFKEIQGGYFGFWGKYLTKNGDWKSNLQTKIAFRLKYLVFNDLHVINLSNEFFFTSIDSFGILTRSLIWSNFTSYQTVFETVCLRKHLYFVDHFNASIVLLVLYLSNLYLHIAGCWHKLLQSFYNMLLKL
jgi:hypothetical protein